MAKRMKDVKYYVEFSGNQFVLYPRAEICKKKFEDLLKNAIDLENSTKKDCEFFVTVFEHISERATYTVTVYFVSTGTTDMVLEKLECKSGYTFVK